MVTAIGVTVAQRYLDYLHADDPEGWPDTTGELLLDHWDDRRQDYDPVPLKLNHRPRRKFTHVVVNMHGRMRGYFIKQTVEHVTSNAELQRHNITFFGRGWYVFCDPKTWTRHESRAKPRNRSLYYTTLDA